MMQFGNNPWHGRATNLILATAALCCCLWPPPTLAQDLFLSGPVPLHIRRPVVILGFRYETIEQEYASIAKQSALKKTDTQFEFNVSTAGFVYHPALVTFDATLRPNFGQSRYESLGEGSGSEQHTFGYDISTQWLRHKPYSVNVNLSKSRGEVDNSYRSPTVTDSSRRSAEMRSSLLDASSVFRVAETETERRGYYSYEQSEKYYQISSKKITDKSRTSLLLEDRKQLRGRGGMTSGGTRQSASLSYGYSISPSARWQSNARYSEYDSAVTFNDRHLASQLELEHPANFRSHWGLYSGTTQSGTNWNRSNGKQGEISHRLYENLSTSLGASTSTATGINGTLQSTAQNLQLAYNRRIPWGHLSIDFARSRKLEDDQRRGDLEQIFNEPHTFAESEITVWLDNFNIELDSVTVTDAFGIVEYEAGIDYWIEIVGNTVVITRDPLAGIEDGNTILVSYLYMRNPPSERQQDMRGFGASLRIGSWLSLGFRDRVMDEVILRGDAGEFSPDNHSRSYTAMVTVGRSQTSFAYSKSTSENFSYVDRNARQTWSTALSPRVSMSFGAFWRETLLGNAMDWNTTYGLNATAGVGFKRGSSLSMGYSLNWFEAGVNKQDAWGMQISYQWRYGAWRPRLSYRQNELNREPVFVAKDDKMLFFYVDRVFR